MGKDPLTVRVHAVVRGRVQGVGFRWFVREQAQEFGVTGWVRNMPDGTVQLEVQGKSETVEEFLRMIQSGHPYARVEGIERSDVAAEHDDDFSIH